MTTTIETELVAETKASCETLDTWTREMIEWHFSPQTGAGSGDEGAV